MQEKHDALLKKVVSTTTPVHTLPKVELFTRPQDGIMGRRCVYDPRLDPKASRNSGKARYKKIIEKKGALPPPDPRLAISGYRTGVYDMPLKSAHITVHAQVQVSTCSVASKTLRL